MADSSLTMSYDETEQKVPTSHDVLNKLDSIANSLKHDWKGNISVELDKDSLGNLQFYNLCNHIGKYKYNCDGQYYFDTIEYPPPPPGVANIPKNDLTWNKLKLYIIRQSHDGGSPVSANDTNNNSSCKFVCFCHRLYKESENKKKGPFQHEYIVNSKKRGSPPNGRDGSRRSVTKRAMSHTTICKFKFQISWDSKGFYINPTSGNPNHSHHPIVDPSKIPVPTRLIPDKEKANLLALAQSCVGAGVGRNFLHSKLGCYFSHAKVAYVQETYNVQFEGKDVPQNDIKRLLEFFKESKEISHQILWDMPITRKGDDIVSNSDSSQLSQKSQPNSNFHKETLCVDLENNNTSSPSETLPNSLSTHANKSPQKLVLTCFDREIGSEPYLIDHSSETGMEALFKEAANIRTLNNVSDSDRIFLCVAWASIEEI